jgi:methylated-DNA-[protein]-cysteine S-methyltransferase
MKSKSQTHREQDSDTASRSFAERVYALLRTVPKGKVTTYADIAHALGSRSYRAVGQALRRNPDAPRTPCHRVVRADGSLGGFMGETSGEPLRRKSVLLTREGVQISDGFVVDFERRRHKF